MTLSDTFAANLAMSRQRFDEQYKPRTLHDLIADKNSQEFVMFERYHRDFCQKPAIERGKILGLIGETLCEYNRQFGKKSWEYRGYKLALSGDLFTAKPGTEEWNYLFQAIAQVIEHKIYGTISRQFSFQSIYYALGFDPQPHLTLERNLKAAVKNGQT